MAELKIMKLNVTLSPLELLAFNCKTGTLVFPGICVESGGGLSPFPITTRGWVGVAVGVAEGVFVGVFVGLMVGVSVGLLVGVMVGLGLGVFVGVSVGEIVGVFVGDMVGVGVGVFVGVLVGVMVAVGVQAPISALKLLTIAMSVIPAELEVVAIPT